MPNEADGCNTVEVLNATGRCLQDAAEALAKEGSTRDYVLQPLNTSLDMICTVANAKPDPCLTNQKLFADILWDVYHAVQCSTAAVEDMDSRMSVSFSSSASSDIKPAVATTAAAAPAVDEERSHIASLQRRVSADMRLSSVAGLAHAKQLLMEAVVLPMRYRHLFTGARKPWKSVLLFGPPGTGKTRLAHAVAAEVNAELYVVSPADLLSSWFGKTEQNIRDLFGQLRERSRRQSVIVFLDEVDGLCRRRTNEEAESTRRMKTELLNQLQEAADGDAPRDQRVNTNGWLAGPHGTEETGQLFFLCATNCPWEIDPAFLRRFQRRIFISLPDRECRLQIIRTLASGSDGADLDLRDAEWEHLLDRTDGFSGSDLADLVKNAMYQPIRELATATHWFPTAGAMWMPCSTNTIGAVRQELQSFPPASVCARNVTIMDFYTVLSSARPTVCKADLARYDQFTDQFGQLG